MAKAKKLPSGKWRCLVYSHTESIQNNADGTVKKVRKYESFTADTKKEAEYLAAEYVLKKNRKLRPQSMTLGEAMQAYIDAKSHVLSPSTIKGYTWIKNHMYLDIQGVSLNHLSSELIQHEINKDAAKRSPKSVRNTYGFFTAVMDMFYKDIKIDVTLPAKVKPPVYVPTDKNIQQLLSCVQGTSFELPVLLSAFGSLRRSEVCALDSTDIHGNTIYITKALVKDVHGKYIIKPPKTFSGYRKITLPDFVIKKMSGIQGRIVPLTPDYITRKFSQILAKNHIPHFRFHDLRHYQASILHALGIPDKYIMKRGGWKSTITLKNIYQHTMEDKQEQFTAVALEHFEKMQHEMQHEK